MSRRDRRLQHRHDQRCPPEEGGCVCCCWNCDPLPRGGRPRLYRILGPGPTSMARELQTRTTPRGRVTIGPVPLPFPHRHRHW